MAYVARALDATMDQALSRKPDLLRELTVEIAAAYIGNNRIARENLPKLIELVHAALTSAGTAATASLPEAAPLVPAVPVRKSVTPDYIVCLEDGKHFKSLKRHLSVRYGLTPDDYRRNWELPDNYPMVAANYAAKRSQLAIALGLGRKAENPQGEPRHDVGDEAGG